MRSQKTKSEVVEEHTLLIVASVSEVWSKQVYTYYLEGKSVHVCTQ